MEQRTSARFIYLESAEVRAVINAIPHVSKHPEMDILIMEIMWQAGARVSEAIQLKPEWIGVSTLILPNLKQIKRVKQKDGTTKRVHDPKADKSVEVSEELCDHLKDYCRREGITRGHYVFQSPRDKAKHVDRRRIHRIMGMASERAGIFKPGKNNPRTGRQFKGASPHQLRHSSAMVLLEQTGDITIAQTQLGHADIRSTQAYAYATQPRVKKAVKEINWYSDGQEKEPKKRKRKKKEVK